MLTKLLSQYRSIAKRQIINGKFLFDTYIIISFFSNETAIVEKLSGNIDFLVPSVVLGESYFGASKSNRSNENLLAIEAFENSVTILRYDSGTARYHGKLKYELLKKGKPIPENDIWIAAVAVQHNFVLVTRDSHFNQIDGIKIEEW